MANDTRTASVTSRSIDEMTDDIATLKSEIEEIEGSIALLNDDIKKQESAIADSTAQREAEHKQWVASDSDDKEAVLTVKRAKDVLAKFYADNNLMLVQQPSAAGEAPPPPPSTWEAPYGGKTGEATSIIAVLDMIISDISKDMEAAKVAENKAQADYDAFKKESEGAIE